MAFKLISAESIKQLSKGDFGNNFDFLLDSIIIPAVGEIFANYCHRPDFDKVERTVFFSPRIYQTRLQLTSPPIYPVSVTPVIAAPRVWEDTAEPRVYGTDTELTSGTDFIVLYNQGIIEKLGSYFAIGPETIKVTCTSGYLTDDGAGVPPKLALAAAIQTKILFDRREEFGVSSRSLEGGSISMLGRLILAPAVRDLLDDYVVYV